MIKVAFKKPFSSRSTGVGKIRTDGILSLVQRVEEEGKPIRERRWHIREIRAGHFVGTMSDAVGPVVIDEVAGRYRFRFKLKSNLSVEQWIAPLPDGQSARSRMTVRRLGVKVATGEGTIRKVSSTSLN